MHIRAGLCLHEAEWTPLCVPALLAPSWSYSHSGSVFGTESKTDRRGQKRLQHKAMKSVSQCLPFQGTRPGDGPREGITQAVAYMDELWRDGCVHHDPLAWPTSSPPHPPEPTCRRSSPGRSPGAPGSWVSPWTRRSRQERWSAAGARHRPCHRRGRR